MATSGTILGNNRLISGGGGAYCRIRIEWQLASQNIGGNYSTINWQTYADFVSGDAQLDGGYTAWNGGVLYNNGGRVYNYTGNFSNHTVGMASGSFNVGHDGAGNGSFNMDGHVTVFNSGLTSAAQNGITLPTIPRYAVIDGFNVDALTDERLQFSWHSDSNVDYISWWSSAYDGGAHHDIPSSGQGWFTINLTNLASEKNFDVTVAVRRADSGLWTTSSTINRTTLKQANMFPARIP